MRAAFAPCLVASACAFRVVIDTNTFNEEELAWSAANFRVNGGTWHITGNSNGISNAEWTAAIRNIGPNVYSEDNPGSTAECARVRELSSGRLTASFQYHETGGEPHTQLSWSEIDEASAKCGGCQIVILTRAYWPNHEWRTHVEEVLAHPQLLGVAMEFGPADAGKRTEGEFVNNLLAAGKEPMFLLPHGYGSPKSAADTFEDAIASFRSLGANMDDERVSVIPARYGQDGFPIHGSGDDTIAAAVHRLQTLQHAPPKGVADVCSSQKISGWARDPDYTGPIAVHVYRDGPAGSGTLVTGISANQPRADVGVHGFSWTPTTDLLQSSHSIYLYFIGVDGTGAVDGQNVQWSKACTIGGAVEQLIV